MSSFRHEALMYAGLDDFVERCSAFIREGIQAGQPILVMVGKRKLDRLREELGADAHKVSWGDMEQVGNNPAHIIPKWREFAEAHRGQSMRGIGEPIWAERTPAELVECQRHESLINLAFQDAGDFVLICPYDTEALPADVIDEACRSHPVITHDERVDESPVYRGLDEIAQPFDERLPPPPPIRYEFSFGPDDLSDVRDFVGRFAMSLNGRAADLITAANEAASNSLRHGGGRGTVRLWDEDGALVCEVLDYGRIEEPLAGRVRPAPLRPGGQGLWIMHQLCDLVQMRAYPDGGAVRMYVRGSGA